MLAAAAAGKHLVIEKPAAISPGELRRMCQAVEQAGVKTIVSFVLRWNPLFQAIKKHLAAGDLGEIYSVETDYQSYNADCWGGWEDGRRADTGVGAMTVAGCHAVDALRWFAAPGEFKAAEPVEVFAWSGGRRKGATRQFNPLDNTWHEGTPLEYDGLEAAANQAIATVRKHGRQRYVLSSGCTLAPDTPAENIAAMMRNATSRMPVA